MWNNVADVERMKKKKKKKKSWKNGWDVLKGRMTLMTRRLPGLLWVEQPKWK